MDQPRPFLKRHVARQLDALDDAARKLIQVELAWRQHAGPKARGIPPSGNVKRALLHRLAGEQNWRCCHCGFRTNEAKTPRQQPTIEHVIPVALGGTDAPSNLAMACADCNQTRGHDLTWTPQQPKGKTR